ncbi:MAG: tetratricopeptide repeat protein [Opitutaceae bacterium]|nr:tetratricopeptide repeat protein [Opitutaceae bacterium]
MIAFVTALVFSSARHGAFLAWDDDINITGNEHLRGLTRENVGWMFSDASYMRRYVPLTWLNWAVEYELFGLTARSSHLGNVLLHGINAALVFVLLLRVLALVRGDRRMPRDVPWLAAAAGALVWALHPLRVEVVAWASGRIYCLAGFFLLLATLAYLQAATGAPDAPERRRWRIAALVALAASLLTYPLAITFVGVLLVVDALLLRRLRLGPGAWSDPVSRTAWLEKIPFVLLTAAVALITIAARFQARGIWTPPPTLAEFGGFERLMQAFYMWGHFVWKPWVPAGLTPVPSTLLGFNPWGLPFLASAAGVLGLTVVLAWQRRRWPGACALWLAHLCLLVPVLGLTERPQFPSDRYSYLQGVLWSLAAASAVVWALQRLTRWQVLAPLALGGAACAVLSVDQIRVWRDSETLFRHVHADLAGHPYRTDLAMRLGDTLRLANRFAEAEPFYREILQVEHAGQRVAVAHFGLARMAQAGGRTAEAEAHYRQALQANPGYAEVNVGLAELLLSARRPAEAVPPLRRAVELWPANLLVRHLLGVALLQSGESGEAVAVFAQAVQMEPRFVGGWGNLVGALLAAGRNAEALASGEEAVRRHPRAAETHVAHARALRAAGRLNEAAAALTRALALTPDHREARELLAQVNGGAPAR